MKVQRFLYGFLNHRNAKISSKWNMFELKKINLISIELLTEKKLTLTKYKDLFVDFESPISSHSLKE